MKPWTRFFLIALAVVGGLYLLVVGTMFFMQRELLYYPTPAGGVPDPAGPSIQIVHIDTQDGERLNGWWLPPQDGKPTILFFGGNASALVEQAGRWRRIADQGVGFLAIGYRGYDGSTGNPTEAGLGEDARAAYDWLTIRVSAEDVVIQGFSLGSGVAVRLASERRARALILEAPFTSTADVAARIYPWAPVRLLLLDQYRSRDRIDRIEMPLLILHGDADQVVPFSQGRALYDLAKAPKMLVRMEGSDHNTLVRDGGYSHIWRFLGLTDLGTTALRGHEAAADMIAAGL